MEAMTGTGWRKSSYSGGGNSQCVEIRGFLGGMAVRDSKDPDGPRLVFTSGDWRAFTHQVKARRHDLAR